MRWARVARRLDEHLWDVVTWLLDHTFPPPGEEPKEGASDDTHAK